VSLVQSLPISLQTCKDQTFNRKTSIYQNKLKNTSRKVGRDLKPTSGQLLDAVMSDRNLSREKCRSRSGCVCHVRGLMYIRLSVSWEIIGCRSSFRGSRTQAIANLSCGLALRLMAHHFPALVPGFLRSFSRGGLRDFLSCFFFLFFSSSSRFFFSFAC
jgi:hypothetical protein